MSTIQELEQKVAQLERDILAKKQETELLVAKADKAVDYAQHAYRVDHYGIIWVWDVELKGYRKTNMRIVTPELSDKSVTTEKLANEAVTGEKIQNKAIGIQHLAPGTIDESKILLSDVSVDVDEDNGDVDVYFINNGDVTDAEMDEDTGDVSLVIK